MKLNKLSQFKKPITSKIENILIYWFMHVEKDINKETHKHYFSNLVFCPKTNFIVIKQLQFPRKISIFFNVESIIFSLHSKLLHIMLFPLFFIISFFKRLLKI